MSKGGARHYHGGIAQLAEHELCKLGVRGSNPLASTITEGLALRSAEERRKEGRVAQLVRARP